MTHLGYGTNKYGTPISKHMCEICKRPFSLCPAVPPEENGWKGCLSWDCESYAVERDAELHFITGNVIKESPP